MLQYKSKKPNNFLKNIPLTCTEVHLLLKNGVTVMAKIAKMTATTHIVMMRIATERTATRASVQA